MFEICVVVKDFRCHSVHNAKNVKRLQVHNRKNISVSFLTICSTVRYNRYHIIKGYPNLTDSLNDGLTAHTVVAQVHLHHTDQEGLVSNACNHIQYVLVTNVGRFISSYIRIFITEKAFQCRKIESNNLGTYILQSVAALGKAPACLQCFSKNGQILSVFSRGMSATVHILT